MAWGEEEGSKDMVLGGQVGIDRRGVGGIEEEGIEKIVFGGGGVLMHGVLQSILRVWY